MIRFKTRTQLATNDSGGEKRLLALEKLIGPRLRDPISREIAISLSAVVDEKRWWAFPLYGSPIARTGDKLLLLELVQAISVADFARRSFGGPVKSASARQLRAVRFQAKKLASALRDLPPDVCWKLLNAARFRPQDPSIAWNRSRLADMEEDFLPKLERLSEAAGRSGARRGIGLTARQMKSAVEDELAFTLALHGIDLEINRVGILAEVLRVGWKHLGIKAGGDPFRTLVRLVGKWQPTAVRQEAERRDAEAAAEAAQSRAQDVLVFAPAQAPRPARRARSARRTDPKS